MLLLELNERGREEKRSEVKTITPLALVLASWLFLKKPTLFVPCCCMYSVYISATTLSSFDWFLLFCFTTQSNSLCLHQLRERVRLLLHGETNNCSVMPTCQAPSRFSPLLHPPFILIIIITALRTFTFSPFLHFFFFYQNSHTMLENKQQHYLTLTILWGRKY